MYGYSLLFSTTPTVYVYVHTSTRSTKLPAIYQLRFYLFTCLLVQLYLSLYLFICLVINTHIHINIYIHTHLTCTTYISCGRHARSYSIETVVHARWALSINGTPTTARIMFAIPCTVDFIVVLSNRAGKMSFRLVLHTGILIAISFCHLSLKFGFCSWRAQCCRGYHR